MNLTEIFRTAFSNGLTGAIDVAVNENDFDERLGFSNEFELIKLSAGIHPLSSASDGKTTWHERFEVIREQARHPDVVAVGESGLDFYRDHVPVRVQKMAFREHLDLASELNKPIIIHNREADRDILELVRGSSCRRGVFHCFSSNRETAEQALELGYYISLAGNLTYRKMGILHEAVRIIPRDRILIETDSPYLAPQHVRSQNNHPGFIGYTLEYLAELRGEDPGELAQSIRDNTQRLFSIES